jgi:hypothetical protein
MNTFSFIKKSRPILKVGDYFYYNINDKNYIGVVIHTHLQKNMKENTAVVCLFLNYTFEDKKNISIENIEKKILDVDFLMPPIIINKRGWTHGFFFNLGNMDIASVFNVLSECRFATSGGGYMSNFNYEPTKEVTDAKLIGKTGLYTYEGVESLLEISLDLDFNPNVSHGSWYDPYRYYDDIKKKYPYLELPFWYYKAEKRLFEDRIK